MIRAAAGQCACLSACVRVRQNPTSPCTSDLCSHTPHCCAQLCALGKIVLSVFTQSFVGLVETRTRIANTQTLYTKQRRMNKHQQTHRHTRRGMHTDTCTRGKSFSQWPCVVVLQCGDVRLSTWKVRRRAAVWRCSFVNVESARLSVAGIGGHCHHIPVRANGDEDRVHFQ